MSFTLPADVENRPVAVTGAGTLGRRIALMFATRGGEVYVDTGRLGVRTGRGCYDHRDQEG